MISFSEATKSLRRLLQKYYMDNVHAPVAQSDTPKRYSQSFLSVDVYVVFRVRQETVRL